MKNFKEEKKSGILETRFHLPSVPERNCDFRFPFPPFQNGRADTRSLRSISLPISGLRPRNQTGGDSEHPYQILLTRDLKGIFEKSKIFEKVTLYRQNFFKDELILSYW